MFDLAPFKQQLPTERGAGGAQWGEGKQIERFPVIVMQATRGLVGETCGRQTLCFGCTAAWDSSSSHPIPQSHAIGSSRERRGVKVVIPLSGSQNDLQRSAPQEVCVHHRLPAMLLSTKRWLQKTWKSGLFTSTFITITVSKGLCGEHSNKMWHAHTNNTPSDDRTKDKDYKATMYRLLPQTSFIKQYGVQKADVAATL